MAQHLIAFAESVTTKGTLQSITPVPDPTVTIESDNVSVPVSYPNVVRAAMLVNNTTATRFQLESPSLRGLYFPELAPYESAVSFENPDDFADFSGNPIPLVGNEGLQFFSDGGGDGTTAKEVYGIVIFSDGPIQPTSGKIRSVRGTLAASAAAAAWNSSQITFDQTLPVGNYDVVGMRVEGTALIAARLIFVGSSAVTRPGCLAQNSAADRGQIQFRMGYPGVLGSFASTNPPSVEVLGGASTSQVVYLDLIKRS